MEEKDTGQEYAKPHVPFFFPITHIVKDSSAALVETWKTLTEARLLTEKEWNTFQPVLTTLASQHPLKNIVVRGPPRDHSHNTLTPLRRIEYVQAWKQTLQETHTPEQIKNILDAEKRYGKHRLELRQRYLS